MTSTIVVPLDGSENAEQILPYATALARRKRAPMLLVSIVDVPVDMGAWTSATATALGRELDAWFNSSETYLQQVAESITDVPVDRIVRIGSAAREIIAIVRDLDDPIIALSSHGRTGASRILMGSVATRLVRDAHCPVLVVRYQPDLPAAAPSFNMVLVPLDGSELAEEGLDLVLSAIGSPSRLHLVRVIDLPVIPAGSMYQPGAPIQYGLVGEYLDAAHAEATEYLRAVRDRVAVDGVGVTVEAREGRIADEILRAAAEQQADLIGMATHGRGGLGRVVFGSVAEGILHASPLPLLLVRPGR
jgi:nucleotide-binding universal stress UspA family protein